MAFLMSLRYWLLLPIACIWCLLAPLWVPIWALVNYYSPDPEKSLVEGYKRPVIGLKLCWRCKLMKYKCWSGKSRHHPDYESLAASSLRGCFCCLIAVQQLATAMEDNANPPVVNDPSDVSLLKAPLLLMRLANNTTSRTGYLDGLRGLDYYQYVYGQKQRPLQAEPSSKASFGIIQKWIDTCNLRHHCYQGSDIILPTRVIDVSNEQPYLLAADGLREPYITLSHCWGNGQPLTTTRSTLETRMKGMPMPTLPKMFRDAVLITRQLGIKYLWIDSLCIIQDSEEDWSQEAARMGNVYRYAFLTLFVLDATDCHQGILVPRSPVPPEYAKLGKAGSSYAMTSLVRNKEDIFKASPLCHRAWALQERLLSPRIIYYSVEEFFWECLVCSAREGSVTIKPYRPAKYSHARYECADVKNRLVIPHGDSPSLPISPSSDWHIIVVEYTRCYLTKPTDKLPALAGLASIFQANTGFTYLAGLWKEDIRDGLLWFVGSHGDQGVRHSEFSNPGPSWSWASSRYPVLYVTVTGSNDSPMRTVSNIKFVDYTITHNVSNPMSDLLDASITIQSEYKNLSYSSNAGGSYVYDGKIRGNVFLDRIEDYTPERKPCTVLWIADRELCTPNWKEANAGQMLQVFVWSYFLVLVQDTRVEGSWRRIGLGRVSRRRGLFNGSMRAEFRLV